jgi:hypothetical protein
MGTSEISLRARSSSPISGLVLNFWFDSEQVGSMSLTTEPQEFRYEFSEIEKQEHCFEIEFKGKTIQHTKINDKGEIIEDVVAEIHDIAFDDIQLQLGQLFTKQARYHHDHNGTTDTVKDSFFGTMGCNGRVTFQFTSPWYLWLLENM